MKNFKRFVIPSSMLVLLFVACSNPSGETTEVEGVSEEIVQSTGNGQVKSNELSTQNSEEIKVDLIQLNKIVNHLNSQSEQLRSEILVAKQDMTTIKKILEKSQIMQKQALQDLMNLNIKTSEVQSLRTKMIDNLMVTEKMYGLSNQEGFNMNNPSAEFKKLALRSQTLQNEIYVELDQLNQNFN